MTLPEGVTHSPPMKTARSAFGIAILGSAFNSGYRGSIDTSFHGLPASAAAAAHDSPATALEVASHAGNGGEQLAAAAHAAFMSGSRAAMTIGAALLVVGAVYVACRGNGADVKAPNPADVAPEPVSDNLPY